MKTDHENTKVRKREKEKGKLNRTRANSGEVARTFCRQKHEERSPKVYELWEMVEVARTRSNFLIKIREGLDFWSMEEKIFELARANLAKFKSCEKAYEIRKLANLANFSSTIRWDFEDLFHPATMTLKSDAELRRGAFPSGSLGTRKQKLAGSNLAKFKSCEKVYEIRKLVNLVNFSSMNRWDFEDLSHPTTMTLKSEAELRRGALPSGSLGTRKQKMAGSNLANLANLAKFKSCKKVYEIRKLVNLVNFSSMNRWDFEDLSHPTTMTLKSEAELRRGAFPSGSLGTRKQKLAGSNLAKLTKFKSCEKVYEIRMLANLANFSSMNRWDFEDLSHPTTMTLKSEAELRRGAFPSGRLGTREQKLARSNLAKLTKLAKLAKFKSCDKVYEIRKLVNLVNFSSTIRWDFEDLSHPTTMTLKSEAELRRGAFPSGSLGTRKRKLAGSNLAKLAKFKSCEKAYEIWMLANLANFFSRIRWDFEDLSHPTLPQSA